MASTIKRVFDDRAYADLIVGASTEVGHLESTLDAQLDIVRETYVWSHASTLIGEFNDCLPQTPGGSVKQTTRQVWDCFEKLLEQLVSAFSLRYVLAFGTDQIGYGDRAMQPLQVVARAGELPTEIADELDLVSFDLSAVPLQYLTSPAFSSASDQRLFEWLSVPAGRFGHPRDRLFMFPAPFVGPGSLAVLVGYDTVSPSGMVLHAGENHLETALQYLYTIVSSALISAIGSVALHGMEAALQVFGHELGQLHAGLDGLRYVYLSSAERVRSLDMYKADDLSQNLDSFLGLLYFLSSSASMVLSIPSPKKERFWAYKEILFKWKDMYRLEAKKKCLQFDLFYPCPDDPLRTEVYGDKHLLEQMVYNLVNNAVKYSFRGTKIKLDCQKLDAVPSAPHIISVTNYGIQVSGGAELYGLYARGMNASERGLGVGLYLANQIAQAHGGNLSHVWPSKQVSRFNVPLIEPYLNLPESPQDLKNDLKEELRQLKSNGMYTKVMALDECEKLRYSEPTTDEILNAISEPTYEVVFEVTIPSGEERT